MSLEMGNFEKSTLERGFRGVLKCRWIMISQIVSSEPMNTPLGTMNHALRFHDTFSPLKRGLLNPLSKLISKKFNLLTQYKI